MYLSFYRLKHKPFQISTDPRFLWLGEKHDEALATLRYGVLDNKGFLLLTGDVGTGKTTLINALLRTLDKNTYVAFIRDPALDPMDFFQYTAYAFGMKISNINSKVSFLIQFEEFLLDAYNNQRKVLLIIDEAQRMSQALLEEVRLLSNIEREDSKLLNIFFVGQIEFNQILHQPDNRAIRQRITINYNIEALTEKETKDYIKHRLEIASSKEEIGFFAPLQRNQDGEYKKQGLRLPLPEVREDLFTAEAIREVFSFSKGYPRLINIICDRALLTGYVEESKAITLKHVRDCVKELEIPHNKDNFVIPKRSEGSLKNSLEELNREFEEKQKLESLKYEQPKDSLPDQIERFENKESTKSIDEISYEVTDLTEGLSYENELETSFENQHDEKKVNIAKYMLGENTDDSDQVFDEEQQLNSDLIPDREQQSIDSDLIPDREQQSIDSDPIPDRERQLINSDLIADGEQQLINSDLIVDGDQDLVESLPEDVYEEEHSNTIRGNDTDETSDVPLSREKDRNTLDVEIPEGVPYEYIQRTPIKRRKNVSKKKILAGCVLGLLTIVYFALTITKKDINLQDEIKNYTKNVFSKNEKSLTNDLDKTKPSNRNDLSPETKQPDQTTKPNENIIILESNVPPPEPTSPEPKPPEPTSPKPKPPEQPPPQDNKQDLSEIKKINKIKEKKKFSKNTKGAERTGNQLSAENQLITDADQITHKIKQLKSLITFEKIIVPFPENSNLPPVNSLVKLNKLVDSLLSHSSFKVTITYFSENQDEKENQSLPELRASAIKSYLMGRGLEDSRITLKGKQDSKKLSPPKMDSMGLVAHRWVEIDVDR